VLTELAKANRKVLGGAGKSSAAAKNAVQGIDGVRAVSSFFVAGNCLDQESQRDTLHRVRIRGNPESDVVSVSAS